MSTKDTHTLCCILCSLCTCYAFWCVHVYLFINVCVCVQVTVGNMYIYLCKDEEAAACLKDAYETAWKCEGPHGNAVGYALPC